MCIRDRVAKAASISPIVVALSVWTCSPMVGAASRTSVSYTHLRAHETRHDLVCRLLRCSPLYSSAASDVYKRQGGKGLINLADRGGVERLDLQPDGRGGFPY